MKNFLSRGSMRGIVFAVAGAVAAATAIAAAPADAATNNQGMSTIPLQVVNNSGHAGKLFVLVIGQLGDTWYYVKDRKGNVTSFADSQGYAKYGLKFGTRTKFKLRIPEVINARVYFSYGKKIQLNTGASGAPSSPAGWTSTDPNYKTLFDWFEYGWAEQVPPISTLPANATYLNGNQTQVDMMGIPMFYTFKGVDANNSTTTVNGGFAKTGARSKIFAAMKKAGLPWAHLVIDARGGQPLREISPYNGITAQRFPPNQLDLYIASVWSKYTGSTKMTADTTGPSQSFTGSVTGGNLVFSRTSPSGGTATFAKPTTFEAYQGAMPPTVSPSSDANLVTGAGELQTMLQAGLMRTTILANGDVSDCPGAKAYYKNAPVNVYSKIIHQFAYQHKAYGFGFDDVCSQSSDGEVFQPTKVIIKIPPFGN